MIFRVKQILNRSNKRPLAIALKKVLFYQESTAENILNTYFIKTYKKTLKQICTEIVKNCKVNARDTQLLISIPNKKFERLANFITYGNRSYRGSNILREAFNQ